MDMSRVASTILRYVCPHLVDDCVKRQLVSEMRDASITVQSDLDIKNVRHWSIKRQRQYNQKHTASQRNVTSSQKNHTSQALVARLENGQKIDKH